MWGTFLSEPLDIVAMVGRYPAIQLMSREPIRPLVAHFNIYRCLSISHGGLVAVSAGYPPGTGMLLTRYAPLRRSPPTGIATHRAAPRLACVKPAASVHPEPGSNSSLYISISLCLSGFSELTLLLCLLVLPVFSNNFHPVSPGHLPHLSAVARFLITGR